MPRVEEPCASGVDMGVLLAALSALKNGNYSVRLPIEWTGLAGKVAEEFNEVAEQNERFAREAERLSRVVGKEGRITQRASMGDVSGFWRDSVDNMNAL